MNHLLNFLKVTAVKITAAVHLTIMALSIISNLNDAPPTPGTPALKPSEARVAPEALAQKVTFTKDIAPIVYSHCANCHRPGEAAPFSLLTYKDLQKRADLIADVTAHRIMPPWKPGPSDYKLDGDFSLTDAQIALIQTWAKTGKKAGNPSDLPPAPKFTPGWKLGNPDLIVKMPKPYTVPADGPDVYRNFTVPLHLDHDIWVKAIEFHPGARTVVHHCLFFFDTTGKAQSLEGEGGQPGFEGSLPIRATNQFAILGFMDSANPQKPQTFGGLGLWAVGDDPVAMQPEYAFFVPKGSDLILSTHFHPSGHTEKETSIVGLYFAEQPPTKAFTGLIFPPMFGETAGIDIPAGSKTYSIQDEFTLPVATTFLNVWAHAHYLGKSFSLIATLPDGTKKDVFNILDWDFNWQASYNFGPVVRLPAGTKLLAKVTYDNTTGNPRNPSNPPKEVFYGEQTTDEMGSVMLRATADTPEDLAALKAAYRKHWINEKRRAEQRQSRTGGSK